MNKHLKIAAALLVALPTLTFAQVRTEQTFEKGWKFTREDSKDFSQQTYDDTKWQSVTVPHDWAIYGPFSIENDKQKVAITQDGQKEALEHAGRTGGLPFVGVGWYRLNFEAPAFSSGKKATLIFDGAMSHARVYINGKEASYWPNGYNAFSVNASPFLKQGESNTLAVRLENFTESSRWYPGAGLYRNVHLIVTDDAHVPVWGTQIITTALTDKYAKVKQTTSWNYPSGKSLSDYVIVTDLVDHNGKIVATNRKQGSDFDNDLFEQEFVIENPAAWTPETPDLYTSISKIYEGDVLKDQYSTTFGIRTVEVRQGEGFFLNGKRIVLRTAISWGFWPYNGITPSDELAKRQITIAKELGLNMLNFHRNIGQTNILDYADELGLLYFEEPGGNQYPIKNFNDNDKQSNFYFAYRNEKLARMVKRDRNHPSLIIYNLHNERGAYPQTQDYDQMRMAHALDPTRILTYNSSNGENPAEEHNTRFKLHLMPYDTTFYDYGWYDRHHAGGPGCYHDNLYLGKDNYHRFSDHKKEIVYWGEDGAIGTPPRLQLIREDILKSGKMNSWEADDYLQWYDAYDRFLKEKGFDKAFPTVDDLTRSMGNVSFYYQGRICLLYTSDAADE